MDTFLSYVFSTNAMALMIPLLIFGISMWLFVKEQIKVWMTLILFGFSMFTGLVIVNHDLLRDALKTKQNKQLANVRKLNQNLEKLNENILSLHSALNQDRNTSEQVAGSFNKLSEIMEEQQNHFQSFTIEILNKVESMASQPQQEEIAEEVIDGSIQKAIEEVVEEIIEQASENKEFIASDPELAESISEVIQEISEKVSQPVEELTPPPETTLTE
ncbi:MAG: hypothetical protein CMO81_00485 [Waddliaceae bacterium]|nr:hypothetical protein [Waddliaceae bacterium]|tara:strand:+ start:54 stop:704 length:651 start_codon:yes stop_codon:yes gene_type:complete